MRRAVLLTLLPFGWRSNHFLRFGANRISWRRSRVCVVTVSLLLRTDHESLIKEGFEFWQRQKIRVGHASSGICPATARALPALADPCAWLAWAAWQHVCPAIGLRSCSR